MNLASIKDLVFDLINEHHNLDGVGVDDYHPSPMRHAMAEGKFLSSIGKLAKTQLLSGQRLEVMARASLERLDELKCFTDQGVGFGLGFDWKAIKGSAPFSITSAVVADGLHEVAPIVSEPAPFLKVLSSTTEWLASPAVVDSVSGLPKFSPYDSSIVTNVVSFWAHVLQESYPDHARLGRHFLEANYVPSVGWPYTPSNSRLDLLHTCYSARCLMSEPRHARHIATAVSHFVTPMGVIDKIDLVSLDESNELARKSVRRHISMGEEYTLILHDRPARVWSIGELLVVCSFRPGGEALDGFWRSLAFQATEEIVSIELATVGPRQKMHLADGLASLLSVARGDNQSTSTAGPIR